VIVLAQGTAGKDDIRIEAPWFDRTGKAVYRVCGKLFQSDREIDRATGIHIGRSLSGENRISSKGQKGVNVTLAFLSKAT
jgi:hypothetical protein